MVFFRDHRYGLPVKSTCFSALKTRPWFLIPANIGLFLNTCYYLWGIQYPFLDSAGTFTLMCMCVHKHKHTHTFGMPSELTSPRYLLLLKIGKIMTKKVGCWMLCVVSLGFYLLDLFVWSVLREWKFTNKKVYLDRYFAMSTVSGIVLSTENTGMNKTHPTHVGSWSSRNKHVKMLLRRELNQHTRQKLCECSHTLKISEKGGRPSSCGAGDPATWQH